MARGSLVAGGHPRKLQFLKCDDGDIRPGENLPGMHELPQPYGAPRRRHVIKLPAVMDAVIDVDAPYLRAKLAGPVMERAHRAAFNFVKGGKSIRIELRKRLAPVGNRQVLWAPAENAMHENDCLRSEIETHMNLPRI
jgi:hypothetical protein